MMRPLSCGIMWAKACLMPQKVADRFHRMVWSHASFSICATGAKPELPPALFTRTSMRP